MHNIAIQGIEGCFHHEAGIHFFGKNNLFVACHQFKDLINSLCKHKDVTRAIMAIENSDAGSILGNYHLLYKNKVQVIGEIYYPIKQQLMMYQNSDIKAINEIHSHPMALLQCSNYLNTLEKKLVETEDTALSAKILSEKKSKTIAVVASKIAAQLYNLNIVQANIQNDKKNITRFLILAKQNEAVTITNADKASIYFVCSHQKGSLAKLLTQIANCNINLSKLQSMPITGTSFNYGFHVDIEFDNLKDFENVNKVLENNTDEYKVFGIYKNGK